MAARFLAHGVAAAVNEHLRAGRDRGGPARPRTLPCPTAQDSIGARAGHRHQPVGHCPASTLALWDLAGKKSGADRSAQMLGGHSDSAECYVTFGFGAYDRDSTRRRRPRPHVERAFALQDARTASPRRGFARDAARVRAVRRRARGDDAVIRDRREREPVGSMPPNVLARMVEDCDLAWFEDPVWRNDARDLAVLRSRDDHTDFGWADGHGHSARFRGVRRARLYRPLHAEQPL